MKTQLVEQGRGRTRRTADERRELVAGFRTSGLGKAEYSRQHGVNLRTFYQWLNGRGMGVVRGQRKTPRFAEVQIPLSANAALEIVLPTGIRLHVNDAALLSALAGFIRDLTPC